MQFAIGDTIIFSYNGERSHDPTPRILVIHNDWQSLVHGLSLNVLTDQETNYLKAVVYPTLAADIMKKDPRIRQELTRIKHQLPHMNIYSPRDFYVRFLKTFIRRYDSYRLYKPMSMSNVKVLTKRKDLVGDQKDKGLFDKYVDRVKGQTGPKFQH